MCLLEEVNIGLLSLEVTEDNFSLDRIGDPVHVQQYYFQPGHRGRVRLRGGTEKCPQSGAGKLPPVMPVSKRGRTELIKYVE